MAVERKCNIADSFFFQAEDGKRGPLWSRGLGEVYKIQVYAPLLRLQLMLAEENKPGSAEYRRLDLRGNIIGLAIVALVVFQPALWKYPSVAILSGAKYLVTKMQIIAAQGQILHRGSE